MMKSNHGGSVILAVAACLMSSVALAADTPAAAPRRPNVAPAPPVQDDGTITAPSFDLPFSSFASPEAVAAFVKRVRTPLPIGKVDILTFRKLTDERMMPNLEKMRALYPTSSTKSVMGGVPVETFVPVAGVAPENQDRVLIEVHGGGFVMGGGGVLGSLEAIPIASVGRFKVVAVDYRLGPEHHFPAASQDVAAVYRELLKSYAPGNIGIYGCSAGGMLAGQMIPWFLKERIPLPGAIGVFCGSLHVFEAGDSAQIHPRLGSAQSGIPPAKPIDSFGMRDAYFAGTHVTDPLAVPAVSKEVMKAFPPTLFMTGTRAPEMSSAAQSHLELKELGVKSELLLYDGMDHGFYTDPGLPESRSAYRLIARFFAENLGVRRSQN